MFINDEFTVCPRSLFNTDGTIHKTTDKAALMREIEALQLVTEELDCPDESDLKYIVIDGMGLVNQIRKTVQMKTVADLCESFNALVEEQVAGFQSVVLVFDQYNIDDGTINLKAATWASRNKGVGVFYKLTMATNIEQIPLKELLSHHKTKHMLTALLAKNTIQLFVAKDSRTRIKFSWMVPVQPLPRRG